MMVSFPSILMNQMIDCNNMMCLTALRIEFCRARARAQRWQEECLLVATEMERTARFFLWDSQRWVIRGKAAALALATHPDPKASKIELWKFGERQKVIRGKVAYAYRQAALRRSLYQTAVDLHTGLIPALRAHDTIVEYEPPAVVRE